MSPNRFWFEVEGGCLDCLLLCPESMKGENPKCPLVQSSEESAEVDV